MEGEGNTNTIYGDGASTGTEFIIEMIKKVSIDVDRIILMLQNDRLSRIETISTSRVGRHPHT